MARYVEFETTVKGGLPVLVKATIFPPEPDIGIDQWQPEFDLFWLKGKPCYIDIPQRDMDRISDECLEEMGL